MIENNEWIEKLQPGDAVIHEDIRGRLSLATVKRITPKTKIITLESGQRFNQHGSGTANTSWDHAFIREATEEALANLKRVKAVAYVKRRLKDYAASLERIKPEFWGELHVNQIHSITLQLNTILEQITQ